MKNIGILLYRYMVIRMDHILHHVLTGLDAMLPAPVSRPALQRVRTPVSPSLNDIRLRSEWHCFKAEPHTRDFVVDSKASLRRS